MGWGWSNLFFLITTYYCLNRVVSDMYDMGVQTERRSGPDLGPDVIVCVRYERFSPTPSCVSIGPSLSASRDDSSSFVVLTRSRSRRCKSPRWCWGWV